MTLRHNKKHVRKRSYRSPQSFAEAYRRSKATRNEQQKRGSGSEARLTECLLLTVINFFVMDLTVFLSLSTGTHFVLYVFLFLNLVLVA